MRSTGIPILIRVVKMMRRFPFYRLISVFLAFCLLLGSLTACSVPAPAGETAVSAGSTGSETSDGSAASDISSSGSTAGTGNPDDATSSAQTGNPNTDPAKAKNIVIGVEYAMPGMAETYSRLGITGVKYFPEEFRWDNMQPSQNAAINFTAMDKFVKEFQQFGFSDIVLSLKTQNKWASVSVISNFTPKPQFMGLFEQWVSAVAERYDKDGSNDMPGLKYPVNYLEIGIEFSSYEPEPAAEYINMLEHAYKAAHAASKTVQVLHSAFLAGLAFVAKPGPGSYEAAFAAVDKRIMTHSLADIRMILDRPDIFDITNFHALCYPAEIEETVKWLKYEMSRRNYSKPIIISDTSVNPFSGYGNALVVKGTPAQLSILSPPAKETDRDRLKTYFLALINKDKASIDWVHAFCATDMVKKVLISAEQGVALINTAFTEEFAPSKSMLFGAAAGNAIWSGMTLTTVKPGSNERVIQEIRPAFYAIRQLASKIKGYSSIVKIILPEAGIQLYKISKNDMYFYIAWYEPENLVLPGDTIPSKSAAISGFGSNAHIERIISAQGQTEPVQFTAAAQNGSLTIELTSFPCYITPQ